MRRITRFLFLIFLPLFLALDLCAQNCACESDEYPNDFFSCDTILFDNKAKLCWHYSCDSVWLTFENAGINRSIYSLEKEMRDYAGRIGYMDFMEYNSVFLAEKKPISGCCYPMEYDVYDKSTGKLTEQLGSLVHYSENRDFPIVVSLENKPSPKLKITNLESSKHYFYVLPKDEIKLLLSEADPIFPNDIFDKIEQQSNLLILSYTIRKTNTPAVTKTITLDLKTYP